MPKVLSLVGAKGGTLKTSSVTAIAHLAAKAGVVNAIDFNYRYMPLVQQARALGGHRRRCHERRLEQHDAERVHRQREVLDEPDFRGP